MLEHEPATRGIRLVGHAAVRQALMDPRLDVVPAGGFSKRLEAGVRPGPQEFLSSWFSRQAPADHQATKRPLTAAYAQSRVAAFEGEIRRHAVQLAAELPDECELVRDFLSPLSLRSMACTLGLAPGHLELLEKVTTAIGKVLARPMFDAAARRAIETSMIVLERFMDSLFALESPPPSVRALQQIASDQERGGSWHAISTLAHVLCAGLHPTTAGAALAWIQHQSRPEVRQALRTGDLAMSDLVSETLRLCPPFPVAHRWAQQSFELHGQWIERGTHVCLDLEAANRDPAVFEEPEQVRRRRGEGHNLAFGHGPHHCVGAGLARIQVQVALETLQALEPPLVLAGPPAIGSTGGLGRLVEVQALRCRRAASTPHAARSLGGMESGSAARSREVEVGADVS
ncbi:MAG: cytochrome P450 [Myxococcales bacterium]|nr:cytochrome P450 [Myxococcales bacterium]